MSLYRSPKLLTAELIERGHRQALDELVSEFNRQMDVQWHLLDLDNLDATRAQWLRHAVETITAHQGQAADIAADFCQDWSKFFTGRGMPIVRPGLQASQVIREAEKALDALGPAGVKARIAKGLAPEAASAQALQAVKAAGAHRVLDADRQTVMKSSAADPRAAGWKRLSHGGCEFCEMLAGRGAVYGVDTATFASHDNCRCTAVPAFGGREVEVEDYKPSARKVSEAQRAQLRDYLADNKPHSSSRKEDEDSSQSQSAQTPAETKPSQEDSRIGRDRAAERQRRGDRTETEEERYRRQQRLKSDMTDLEARDGAPREVLESHELDFVERFEARGERVRWIRRDTQNYTPTNDFEWLTGGGQACELKSSSDKYSTISKRIRSAAVAADRQGVVKDVFIVDLGLRRMPDKLRNQLERYNVNSAHGRIRALYVMHDDGATFEEINLA